MKKVTPKIKKYEKIGLTMFVAIPLPVTGGWTAAIAAFLLGMPFKIAFPLISLGVLIAGIIVSRLTLSGVMVGKIFGWEVLISVIITILIFYFFYRFIINKKKL